MDKNRQVLLASRPNGAPTAENFELAEVDIPRPGENEMLLRTVYLSLDPYMRGRMNSEKSYAEPVPVILSNLQLLSLLRKSFTYDIS